MNETLSAEKFEYWKKESEANAGTENGDRPWYGFDDMQLAINTIEARDKEIEALKGQVTASRELLAVLMAWQITKSEHGVLDLDVKRSYDSGMDFINNTQATAEAFIAKERADEREKTIRECVDVAYDYFDDGNETVIGELEALLTKEEKPSKKPHTIDDSIAEIATISAIPRCRYCYREEKYCECKDQA
jgi:hypothetical protein